MAIGEHHPRVDHRCEVGRHHAPAETLHVDELEQGRILDVGAGHIAHIHRQPAGQAQAGQWRFEEHLGQVGGILQRQQRHRIEAVEHLPAGVVEAADALGLMGEAGAEIGDEALVIAVHRHIQAVGQVVFELGWVGHGGAVLAHVGQGAGEQVGVPLLPKAEDHRGAHVKGVALAFEAAAAAPRDQVALQHQHLGALGGQLAGGHQAADAAADHDHIPGGGGAGGHRCGWRGWGDPRCQGCRPAGTASGQLHRDGGGDRRRILGPHGDQQQLGAGGPECRP